MDPSKHIDKVKTDWNSLKHSSGFKNFLQYLAFVAIATVFWFILAMNDSVQDTFAVRLHIYNMPDSVTFINNPPQTINVNVRDRGTQLFRNGMMRQPTININFKEFAQGGVFRFPSASLYEALRSTFGQSAQVSTVSVDSLRLNYTSNPGKRVPIVLNSKITTASGNVIAGNLVPSRKDVLVYADKNVLDTVTRVFTEPIKGDNLAQTSVISVKIKPIANARVEPSKIEVTVPIEPLVNKHKMVDVKVINTPNDISLMLFPSKIEVSYFTPLSKFNEDKDDIRVIADYNRIDETPDNRIGIVIEGHGNDVVNPSLANDYVEYTIVR